MIRKCIACGNHFVSDAPRDRCSFHADLETQHRLADRAFWSVIVIVALAVAVVLAVEVVTEFAAWGVW
jgi:hypothetical protein